MAIKRWYRSKVDWWLGVILALAPLASLAAAIGAYQAGNSFAAAIGGTAVLAAVYLGLVFPMRYGIDDLHLVVRYGLVRQRIPLCDITGVSPTRNPLSSPALSLDRLAIEYDRGFFRSMMISPAEKAEFLAELAERTGLRRDGERLVR